MIPATVELPPLGAVIVPAHDEAAVIGQTLRSLVDGLDLDRVRVVVACNGCTDGTAEVVRSLALDIEVLELETPGKAAAIAAAEALDLPLPRLYVDADVQLAGSAATGLLDALATGAVAARPPVHLDVTGASQVVQRYARCREALMSDPPELWGAGVYGLSAAARQRFGRFPTLIADDLFAARVVRPDEVRVPDVAAVQVRLPRTARALVSTLSRAHRGNAQLAALHPGLAPRTTATTVRRLARMAAVPANWLDLSAFVLITATARLLARRSGRGWQCDTTTRIAPPADEDHR